MTETTKLKTDCLERVAYDLMQQIFANESSVTPNRAYWLKLYHECLFVVRGRDLPESSETS